MDKIDEGGGGQKMSVFVHAQGIKNVYAGVKKRKNSVHVVDEWPLMDITHFGPIWYQH